MSTSELLWAIPALALILTALFYCVDTFAAIRFRSMKVEMILFRIALVAVCAPLSAFIYLNGVAS